MWDTAVVKSELSRKRLADVRGFIGELYGQDLHAKRVEALAAATFGVMTGASLAVATIGRALAQARGLVTSHGRAAPLIWLTVWREEIATRHNGLEDTCLRRLAETAPLDSRVTILTDRGFGSHKLSNVWIGKNRSLDGRCTHAVLPRYIRARQTKRSETRVMCRFARRGDPAVNAEQITVSRGDREGVVSDGSRQKHHFQLRGNTGSVGFNVLSDISPTLQFQQSRGAPALPVADPFSVYRSRLSIRPWIDLLHVQFQQAGYDGVLTNVLAKTKDSHQLLANSLGGQSRRHAATRCGPGSHGAQHRRAHRRQRLTLHPERRAHQQFGRLWFVADPGRSRFLGGRAIGRLAGSHAAGSTAA